MIVECRVASLTGKGGSEPPVVTNDAGEENTRFSGRNQPRTLVLLDCSVWAGLETLVRFLSDNRLPRWNHTLGVSAVSAYN